MVVNLANFIEYFATPISGQVTFQRQGYESDLAFAMDAKYGMYQSSPGERTPFFGAAFCAVIGGCMEMSRNVQSGNTQNLKSMVIQRSFPKWSVAERRKTAAASDQAAVCACAHSRYFAGGSPSGLRV